MSDLEKKTQIPFFGKFTKKQENLRNRPRNRVETWKIAKIEKNGFCFFFSGRSYEPEIMKFGGKRLQTLKKGTRNLLLGVDQMLTILGGNSEKMGFENIP